MIGGDGTALSVEIATRTASGPISIGLTAYVSEAANGSIWLRGSDLDLRQIDPATGETLATFPVDGTDFPGGFVIVGDEAWVANLDRGTVSRISLTDDLIHARAFENAVVGDPPFAFACWVEPLPC